MDDIRADRSEYKSSSPTLCSSLLYSSLRSSQEVRTTTRWVEGEKVTVEVVPLWFYLPMVNGEVKNTDKGWRR